MGKTNSASLLPRRQLPEVAGIRIFGKDKLFRLDGLLPPKMMTIGRSRHRDIRIRDKSVSDLHANIICLEKGKFRIRDRNSTNGVYVRDGFYDDYQPVTAHELKVGTHIRLGNVILVAVDADGTCDIVARRYSEFMRNSWALYGSARKAAHYIGRRSHTTIRRWLSHGKDSKK